MTCPNCGHETEQILFRTEGLRCHGCLNPKLDRAGNLRARIEQLSEYAAKQESATRLALAGEIGELTLKLEACNQ